MPRDGEAQQKCGILEKQEIPMYDEGMPPVLIKTPFPTPEEVARIYGIPKSRVKWLTRLVDAHPRNDVFEVKANPPKSKSKTGSGKRTATKKYRASSKRRRGGRAAA
jgi:hypothetical protein